MRQSSVPIADEAVNKHKGMMTSLLSHHDASDTVACRKHRFWVHSQIQFLVLLDKPASAAAVDTEG